MVEKHHNKQQITAALTVLKTHVQNESSFLKRKLDMKQHILASIKIIRGNGPAAPLLLAGFCLEFPPVKRVSILTGSVKSRSNVVTRGRYARFGEKFGNTPNR
jgi:hypothetical protein